MSNEELVAIAKLETKVDNIERSVNELKSDLKMVTQVSSQPTSQSKAPVLSVTGGLVGLAAAVWTGYLQATGRA